jgi:hypothetical protein
VETKNRFGDQDTDRLPDSRFAAKTAGQDDWRTGDRRRSGGIRMEDNVTPRAPEPGHDTATGTDPDAKYEVPGYEDKSFGQAVNQDQELVEELLEETGGNVGESERRFRRESAGSPAIERQNETE